MATNYYLTRLMIDKRLFYSLYDEVEELINDYGKEKYIDHIESVFKYDISDEKRSDIIRKTKSNAYCLMKEIKKEHDITIWEDNEHGYTFDMCFGDIDDIDWYDQTLEIFSEYWYQVYQMEQY